MHILSARFPNLARRRLGPSSPRNSRGRPGRRSRCRSSSPASDGQRRQSRRPGRRRPHCQTLAAAAGGGGKTWRAYLSASAATAAGGQRSRPHRRRSLVQREGRAHRAERRATCTATRSSGAPRQQPHQGDRDHREGRAGQRRRRHAEPARHPDWLAARRPRVHRRRRSHLQQLDEQRRPAPRSSATRSHRRRQHVVELGARRAAAAARRIWWPPAAPALLLLRDQLRRKNDDSGRVEADDHAGGAGRHRHPRRHDRARGGCSESGEARSADRRFRRSPARRSSLASSKSGRARKRWRTRKGSSS